jgi:purine nucleoside permease
MTRASRFRWLAIAVALLASRPAAPGRPVDRIAVKVLVIAPTAAEIQPWTARFGLTDTGAIAGLSPSFPSLLCNGDGVCAVATGAGKANAAATIAAVAFSGRFDLSVAYFLIAELARIDPSRGTLDSAVWVHGAIDVGIAWEIGARTLPVGWTTGYLGIDASSPTAQPGVNFGTEQLTLAPSLVAKAVSLSSAVTLADAPAAAAYRALYTDAAATAAPRVLEGDTASSDTYWHGALLGQRAHDWVAQVSGGAATYTTMQQTDNATIGALTAVAATGALDAKRIAVLHSIFHFDRPHPGQAAYDSLRADSGALATALDNLAVVGAPVVTDIVAYWGDWQTGVPQ